MIFYINFILIFTLVPVKIIDFLMSLKYIGTNNICEVNPFGYIFLNNPLVMFIAFIGLILFFVLFNIIIRKSFRELGFLLLFILILMDFIGFYVLFNNFQIFLERCI